MHALETLISKSQKFDFAFSVAKIDSRVLIFANEAFCELTGYSSNEIVGKNCKFLQVPETSEASISAMRSAFKAHRATFQELVNYRKDGDKFINRLILLPLIQNGEEFILGFQNEVNLYDADPTKMLSLEMIHLSDADINHYINNPLTIAVHAIETNNEEKFCSAIGRIRDFVLAIEDPDTFPKVY